MNKQEVRTFDTDELRVEDGDGSPRIIGYAAVFDSMSEPLGFGGFREIIRPGAFKQATKRGADIRALVDHDSAKVLGRTRAGTLKLQQDDRGLRMEIDPPDTTYARDLAESLRRGDVSGASFRFEAVKEEWSGTLEEPLRELKQVNISEVSVVTFPAYPDTEVAMRSLNEWKELQTVVPVRVLELKLQTLEAET
jgi:HK97 family phage prohead protease